MGIVDEDVIRVRESTDIVALISQYVQLRRVGQRWSGLCPFHNEKTPSFSVDPTSGLYHCFGCKASGDAITFVREKEQTDFVGAVEILAGKAGFTLRYTDQFEADSRKKRAKLHDQLERAVEWYHERLKKAPDAAAARSYLRGRGFSSAEVEHYRIGWAPDDWDQLMRGLRIGGAEAESAGLGFTNRAGRAQDFFRARVLFPIFDDRGRPIGFGGRKLPGAEGAKYKNSRDNDVYHKSRALYGLNWAKEQAVQRNEIVVCEGYTDVIGFHRAGVQRAVATCGTALTEDHVRMIRRFAGRLVLAYDADEAGQSAAERVYAWERTHDIEVAVVELPPGQDPGELALDDAEALRQAVDDARPFLKFRIDRVLGSANLATPEGRSRAAQQALSVVSEHPDAFVRDQYLMEIADVCRVDIELLRAPTTPSGPNLRAKETRTRSIPNSPDEASSMPGPGRGRQRPGAHALSGRGGSRNEASGPGRRPNAVEVEAFKLYVNRPDHIERYLSAAMFTDPRLRAAYTLVETSGGLAAARDVASPEMAQFLASIAVDSTEPDPVDVLVRLATELGRVVMADLEAQARSSSNPLAFVESITWLKLSIDALRTSRVEVEKLDELLVWLGERRREAEQG